MQAKMGLSPLQCYEQDIASGQFQFDPAQNSAVVALTEVHAALIQRFEIAKKVRGPARLREI